MDRYSFLHAVLPPQGNGNYVASFIRGDKKNKIAWNRNCDTIEALADLCVEAATEGLTSYYALGTFENNVTTSDSGRPKYQRLAVQAQKFKTLAIDIDAGKVSDTPTYETSEEALAALVQFIKNSGIPVPMVVASGHGFHAYWPLDEVVDKATWRDLGVGLKALCLAHGLKIDPGKVHDPSMVLRPLDTLNKGQVVRVIVPGSGFHSPMELAKKLAVTTDGPRRIPVSAKARLNAEASCGLDDYQPVDHTLITDRCLQLKAATKDGGRNASYDQWFLALGVAKYAIDPELAAKEWTGNHPDYSEASMEKKSNEYKATGIPKCMTFDSKIPGICGKCPHWGRVQTPYQLGIPVPKPLNGLSFTPIHEQQQSSPDTAPVQEEPIQESIPESIQDDSPPTPDFHIDPKRCAPAIDPPKPFLRTEKGIGFTNEGVWNSVCEYDVFPTHMVRDPSLGYSMVEWAWYKPHVGYTRMLIRASSIFNDNSTVELNNALADNGLLIENKVKQAFMGAYMRAYTQALQRHQASVDLYDSFGWKENNTRFVIGSTEFRREKDGTVSTHEVGVSKIISTKEYDKTFAARGDLGLWATWTTALDHPTLATHQIELARAFMAPLIHFTGLRGVVFSLVGPSGRGKTTMQRWAASVYGAPDKVNTTANDTQMSMVQRMGVWGCLPLAIDEATLIKPEHLANLIYWGTQGQDRNRANEVTQANTWALPLSLSTNRSLRDKATTVGADVDAIQMRMLEFEIPSSPVFADSSDFGRRMFLMSGDNYGLAGRVYIQHLLRKGEDQIRADIEEHTKYIAKQYDFAFEGKERFWQTAVVLCDLGSKYAKELGLIKYDYTKGTRAMLEQLGEQRVALAGARLDSYDMISDYLAQHNGMALTVVYRDGVATPQHPYPRGEVRIRKELYAKGGDSKPDRGFFYLDKSHFHHWLVGRGFDYKTVTDTLTKDQSGFRPSKSGRIYMGKDSAITLPSCAAIGLNMNHEKFKGVLNQIDLTEKVVDINAARGEKK